MNDIYKRTIAAIVLISVVVLIRLFGLFDWFTLSYLQQHASNLYGWVQAHYIRALIYYIIFFITASIIAVPVTALLTIAGGFLFGLIWGTLLATVSATLGGALLFFIARYLMYDWVQKQYEVPLFVFKKLLIQEGHWYLLTMQIFPFTPTPFINIIAGILPISWWTFIWTTAIGILPGSFLYVWAGQQLHTIKSVRDIMSWQMILIFLLGTLLMLLPVIWRRLPLFPKE